MPTPFEEEVTRRLSNDLLPVLAIPSISMLPQKEGEEDHSADVITCALHLRNYLRDVVGAEARVVPTKGHPAVFGKLDVKEGAPTIVFYNHYDVQPVAGQTWKRNPFQPVLEDGAFWARGATDDKGPLMAALTAIDTMSRRGELGVNVRFVLEGEEEIGGPNFRSVLDSVKGEMGEVDGIVICDTLELGGKPTITTSLRGIVTATLTHKVSAKPVHSGLGGGGVINPIAVLAYAIGNCKDPSGRLSMPGIYAGMRNLTPEDEAILAGLNFDVERFWKEVGDVEKPVTRDPVRLLKHLWFEPSFDVHYIEGGSKSNTIPDKAEAGVSIRLAPGQNPETIKAFFENHLRRMVPDIGLEFGPSLPPFEVGRNHPYMQAAFEAARDGFEREPAYIGCGGSIGATTDFAAVYPGRPVIMPSMSTERDGYHSTDERFYLQQAIGGAKTVRHLLKRVETIGRVVA